MSPLSIILLSPVISSESGEKYAQIKHCLQAKTVQICSSMLVGFDVRGHKRMDFFTV